MTNFTEFHAGLTEIFTMAIPLNRFVGLEVKSLNIDNPQLGFQMKPELVGNFIRGILHGGVISSVIDITGGLTVLLGIQKWHTEAPAQSVLQHFNRISTIDLRVDFLRPGLGQTFVSTGFLLRTGRKVAVSRVELRCDQDKLIAAGTCVYSVS